MAGRFEKSIVRAGLALQRLDGVPLLGGAYNRVRGSSAPAYSQLNWIEAAAVIDDEGEPASLLEIEADPHPMFMGDIIMCRKKEAAVIAVGREALLDTMRNTSGDVGMVCTVGNIAIAAVTPAGLGDLGYSRETNEHFAAIRAGKYPFKFSLAAIADRTAYVPAGQRVSAEHLPLSLPNQPARTRVF